MCIPEFVKQTCIYKECGIVWYQPSGFDQQRHKDHIVFYCPNGHGQHYLKKTNEDLLREENKALISNRDYYKSERDRFQKCAEKKKHQINGLRGYIKKLQKKK